MNGQIQLGKYRLYHHLATGGMGEVYLARQEGLAGFAKNVVVKRILPNVAADPAFVTMFLNEARLAALIEHPNVVQIFDLGYEDNTHFIAMEYVHGLSLRHVRNALFEKKQTCPPEIAARICSQALQGLHHAHNLSDETGRPLQIVHRDVSPDNLLIGFNGVVKVVDFGIAKAVVNVSTTRAGTIKGKYAYMAPEQLTNGEIDRRADIYAMGAVLYELVTGHRPFSATSEAGLIRAILEDTIPRPETHNPALSSTLSDVLMRALARRPDDRFPTAEDMSLALEAYILSTGKTVTNVHIGALLSSLFPGAAAQKTPSPPRNLQHSVSYGLTPSGSLPPGSHLSPSTSSRNGVPPAPPGAEEQLPEIEILVDNDDRRSRRRPGTIIGAAAGVLILVAGAAFVVPRFFGSDAPDDPAASASAASPAQASAPEKDAPPSAKTPTSGPSAPAKSDTAPTPVAVTAAAGDTAASAEDEASSGSVGEQGAQSAHRTRISTRANQKPKRSQPAPAVTATARAPEPDREAEQPVAKTGRVMLRVNPWAEVFWSGRSIGITPMDPVELPAGRQVLTLRNPNLKLERKVTVNVIPGELVSLKADLLE